MIIQTDQALLKRGYKFDFLKRYQQKSVDLVNLYEEHKVCKKCYKLYKETEKLLEVELELNKVLGIPVTQDTKHDLLSMTCQDINEPSFKERLKAKYSTSNRTQPYYRNVDVHDTVSSVKQPLYMYRLMVMFNELLEIPEYLDTNKSYSICYTLFNQKHRLLLDLTQV
jgi:LMBR1 domain-containing protein 1